MSADEEQQMEIEALQCIFMDDFKYVSEKVPRAFELNVFPNMADSGDNHVGACLAVSLPKQYPEKAPTIQVRSLKSLTSINRTALQTLVDQLVEEQTGTTMMYNITEAVKEWMQERNVKAMSMHEQMTERQKIADIKAEAEATKKTVQQEKISEQIKHGTPVTPVVFAEWNERFLAERKAKKDALLAQQQQIVEAERKLTGKQIFMELQQTAALALAEAERLGKAETVAAENIFCVDESLYANDEDLPDDESESEEEEFVDSEVDEEAAHAAEADS